MPSYLTIFHVLYLANFGQKQGETKTLSDVHAEISRGLAPSGKCLLDLWNEDSPLVGNRSLMQEIAAEGMMVLNAHRLQCGVQPRRFVVIANNPHPHPDVLRFVETANLTATDAVVRFNQMSNCEWFDGHMTGFLWLFSRKSERQPGVYYRSSSECDVLSKNKNAKLFLVNYHLNRPVSERNNTHADGVLLCSFMEAAFHNQTQPSTGFAVVTWIRKTFPTSEIILLGFDSHAERHVEGVHKWSEERLWLNQMMKEGHVLNATQALASEV